MVIECYGPGVMQLGRAARTAGSTVTHIWGHPAVRGERARAVGRYLGWQGWQVAFGRPITVTMVGGMRLRCHPHSTAASGVLYTRLPEWESMRFLLDYLRPGEAFVDVGANVGTYTLLAASVEGTRVVAFEPSSRTHARLAENVRLNGLDRPGRVDARPVAVGDRDGWVELTVGLDTVNRIVPSQPRGPASGWGADPTPPAESVAICRLDTALADVPGVGLIKIDVEGHEPAVLRGARELISRDGPALIAECNDPARLTALLDELGYTPCRYEPARRWLVRIDPRHERPTNVIAVRDLSLARDRVATPARDGVATLPRVSRGNSRRENLRSRA